jgi:hypothetical protein
VPHDLDLQFPIERLDFNSMIHHKFVSPHACLDNLSFEITLFKESAWKVVKTDRSVYLPELSYLTLIAEMDGHSWRMSLTHT